MSSQAFDTAPIVQHGTWQEGQHLGSERAECAIKAPHTAMTAPVLSTLRMPSQERTSLTATQRVWWTTQKAWGCTSALAHRVRGTRFSGTTPTTETETDDSMMPSPMSVSLSVSTETVHCMSSTWEARAWFVFA